MLHGLVAAQDLLAAACGGLNTLYFLHYWLRRRPSPRRRLGAAALATVNAALVVESLFFLALYASWHGQGAAEPFLWPVVWLPARLPLLLGAAFISVLVPVNCGQELYDVVEVTDTRWPGSPPPAGACWR